MRRRTFLSLVAATVHATIGVALAIPGVRFLLAPLRRRTGVPDFIRVAPMSALREGEPFRATVLSDRWDAYTHHPAGPVGSVWLLRGADAGSEPVVRCFQSICPHLGCGIDFVPGRSSFECPCHNAVFSVSGEVVSGPAPRDMDGLQVRVTAPDADGTRWVEVRYAEFQTGIAESRTLT